MTSFRFFLKYHKWVGLLSIFFILVFSLSGIILNHRKLLSGLSVSRELLPANYRYNHWNNNALKAAFPLSPDSILLYGGSGIWLTDSTFSHYSDFSSGLKSGADNHICSKIVGTSSGSIFAATTFDLYQLNSAGSWTSVSKLLDNRERIADLAVKGDSLLVLTRSELFVASSQNLSFRKVKLLAPKDYTPETGLFRLLWLLHSGELFGISGQLFVDLLGIVLILLSITGLIYYLMPGIIRRRRKQARTLEPAKRTFRTAIQWHHQAGYWLFAFLCCLSVTGMFLRPPLMIAIIRAKVMPPPYSTLDNPNPWHDKLRSISYDYQDHDWLLYSSSGFYSLRTLETQPQKIEHTPPVSVMGINVLEPHGAKWLVGSFSGLYLWDRHNPIVTDCITGKVIKAPKSSGRPVFDHTVTGYMHTAYTGPVLFEYEKGALSLDTNKHPIEMPDILHQVPISLWHLALELHVGRAYSSLLGPLSDLFVFVSGFLLSLLLVSGYVLYRRRLRHKQ